MLTQGDIEEIERIIEEKISERTRLLPTREEFFTAMAELMGEVKAVRESQEAHTGDHGRISDRLEQLEKHAGLTVSL